MPSSYLSKAPTHYPIKQFPLHPRTFVTVTPLPLSTPLRPHR